MESRIAELLTVNILSIYFKFLVPGLIHHNIEILVLTTLKLITYNHRIAKKIITNGSAFTWYAMTMNFQFNVPQMIRGFVVHTLYAYPGD